MAVERAVLKLRESVCRSFGLSGLQDVKMKDLAQKKRLIDLNEAIMRQQIEKRQFC